ncbi:head GIN domain-containing protein [Chloroflexota bacterium]
MRKNIITLILTAVLITVLLSGCTGTASGDVIAEEKNFFGFTRLDIGSAFEVEVTRSDTFSVIISADESLYDYIEVSQTGDTLKIYLEPHHIFTDFTVGEKTLKAEIAIPVLYGLELSGACKGTVSGFRSPNDFSLIVSGASTLSELEIEAGNVDFEISGASSVSGNLTAIGVEFEISGASKVELTGSADDIILGVSGASTAELGDFPLDNVNVNLSGFSSATVNVRGRLDTTLSGASSLYFEGNPTMGYTDVSGASTIKHK